MKQRPRIYYTEEQKALMWDRWQSGESEVSLPGSKTPGFPVIDWTVFERENPRILVSDPMLLGEGWNCWGYRANADMVVKVPKTGDWGDLENEIAFSRSSCERASSSTAYCSSTRVTSIRARLCRLHVRSRCRAGHRSIGRCLCLSRPGRFPRSFAQVAGDTTHPFCRGGRGFRVSESARLLRAINERKLLSSRACSAIGPIVQRHETRYSHPRPLVFIHKDFGPSNILMHDSRVSGVIDFGNIAIGDADADFVEIWENMGDGALRAVAAAYGHPNPDDLLNAVRDFSVLNGLEVLVDDKTFAPKGVWQGLQARFEEKFGNST